MQKESEVCRSCPNSFLGCDKHLTPKGVGGGLANYYLGCIHLTCDMGLAELKRAVRNHARSHGGIMVQNVEFHSLHKPLPTRRVDPSGIIWSEENGEFFQTGQRVNITELLK
jgi:hypothetical protein